MSVAARTDTQQTKSPPTTIARIAVGVNGYPEGEDAVVLGASMAGVMKAELMLVAVHPESLVVLPYEVSWKTVHEQEADALRRTRNSLAPEARVVVETDLSVPRALQRVVVREHRDLLVVGSSRHAPPARVRIGKRTRELLGQSESALAIAPRGFRNQRTHKLQRIGVGFDGRGESDVALRWAGAIACAAGAELRVCAVVDDRLPPLAWSALSTDATTLARVEEGVRAEMDALREFGLSGARATGATAQAGVTRGRPADALLKLSQEVDLLVIGSRRWGAVARVVLGSTGEALAHDSSCPLLVAPRPTG